MATPTEWLKEADEEIELVRHLVAQRSPKWACFHAQQVAEKALKAVLLYQGARPPKIHDLPKLLELIRRSEPGFPGRTEFMEKLTKYCMVIRYLDTRPAAWTAPELHDAQEASTLAEAIVADVRARIAPPAPPPAAASSAGSAPPPPPCE